MKKEVLQQEGTVTTDFQDIPTTQVDVRLLNLDTYNAVVNYLQSKSEEAALLAALVQSPATKVTIKNAAA